MAILGSKARAMCAMAVIGVASLAGVASAAEAPAPSPTSGAGALSPHLAYAFVASASALLLGSLLR